MKEHDFKNLIKELEEQIQKNKKEKDIDDERMRMAKVNNYFNKIINRLGLSTISYAILLVFVVLFKGIFYPSIFMPNHSFLYILGAAFLIGNGWEILLSNKYQTKKRLQAFTKAKSSEDLLKEEVRYKVELEKNKNQQKMIEEVLSLINRDQEQANLLLQNYDLETKKEIIDKEELKREVESLMNILEKKTQEFNISIFQSVVHEKFWQVRYKNSCIKDILFSSLSCVVLLFGLAIPMVVLGTPNIFLLLSLFMVGSLGGASYAIAKNKIYHKVFQYFNQELGKNALPDEITEAYPEKKAISDKLEKLKQQMIQTKYQLEIKKQKLQSYDEVESDSLDGQLTFMPELTETKDERLIYVTQNSEDKPFVLERKKEY